MVSANIFWFYLAPDLFKLKLFDKFGNSKVFHTVLT